MSGKNMKVRIGMVVLLAGVLTATVYAGSAVIGSVAGSKNATVGGQALVPNTTLFSGDSLQVKDGVAVVAMGQGSRMVFGKETTASFLREADGVTVLLGQGNVSMYHPENGVGIRVKAGEVTVEPGKGYETRGEIAMVNGGLVVTAKEGTLRVEGKGPAVEVAKGKTIQVSTQGAAAPAPQAPAAGAPVSGLTAGQVVGIAGAGAAGVGAGFSIAARSKASDALTEAQKATAAAEAAAAAAKAACQAAVSGTTPTACL
jgi:hypothetical protein